MSAAELRRLWNGFAVCWGFPRGAHAESGSTEAVREWLERVGVQTLFIEPGSPWENGYVESFFGKLRVVVEREIFYTLREARVLIERWRLHYNRRRPHMSLGHRPPAPVAVRPLPLTWSSVGSLMT